MPNAEHYKVTVAGGGGRTVAHGSVLGLLVPKALDLAKDGWTSFIKNRLGSVVEFRRADGGEITLTYHVGDADWHGVSVGGTEPDWVQKIRQILSSC